MAQFSFTDGLNETEPTLIPDGAVQDCTGAEYRVGEVGLFVARGRDLYGTISSSTLIGGYEAGFDAAQTVIAHIGNSYFWGTVGVTQIGLTYFDGFATGTSAIVGSHYSNRHYTANGAINRRIEYSTTSPVGVTSFPIGMSRSTYGIGVSVTQGAGSMSASTGLVYWATEYDSSRGIESMTGSSVSTGVFVSLDSVVVIVTGLSSNSQADQIRWYRSVDGGGFPDAGLIATTAIGTTTITDTLTTTSSLTVPQYGIIGIGGLDTERDEPPDAMSVIFGPFQDSLLGVAVADGRTLRFTPAGYPDSWPTQYGIPIDTSRNDEIVTGVVLPGRIGVFCKDSVHVIYRLPRDSDSVFASGEAQDEITQARGCVSRRGACTFTPVGGQALAAFVSRDGIWATSLVPSSSPMPLTDRLDWETRVDTANLSGCSLVDDPIHRRIVFIHRKATDATHNTGIWYLDYQKFDEIGMRITIGDHGPLCDAITVAMPDGTRQMVSFDSRSGNGQLYIEGSQDVDDSQMLDASGSVRFRVRSKEFMPAGANAVVHLGKATWMHDAAPSRVEHSLYINRRDSNPITKVMSDWTSREASAVSLQREVNSFSVELHSAGTQSYGVHWVDIEGFDTGLMGSRKGA